MQIESVRSQRVKHIACGEDHTALLTEVNRGTIMNSVVNFQAILHMKKSFLNKYCA